MGELLWVSAFRISTCVHPSIQQMLLRYLLYARHCLWLTSSTFPDIHTPSLCPFIHPPTHPSTHPSIQLSVPSLTHLFNQCSLGT